MNSARRFIHGAVEGKQSSGVYRIYTLSIGSIIKIILGITCIVPTIIYIYIIGVCDSIYSVFHPMKCVESDVMCSIN